MWKINTIFVIILLIGFIHSAEEENQKRSNEQTVMAVGQSMSGSIDITQSNQHVHFLRVDKIEKKYLFVIVNTLTPTKMSIGIYSNETRKLIHACENTTFDSCYISSSHLQPDSVYAILIVVFESAHYKAQTYWGDLEHIKPNQKINFAFDKLNPSQLIHLQFDEKTQFQQIHILLKPETERSHGDTLRIFANRGFNQDPTAEKHDFASTHVWNDAEAIFLSKSDLRGQVGVTLFTVGNAETVYTLQCQFVEQKTHQLKIDETLYEYLPKGEFTHYQMSFKGNNNTDRSDSFTLKLSVFTGELQVGFYYDKDFKKAYEKFPYQYMSDMQFNFNKNDFEKGTQQIFVKVRCTDSPATYQLSAQSRIKQTAFEITENVYEFSFLKDPFQAMYFFSRIWDEGQYEQVKQYRYDISFIRLFGAPLIEFYICKPQSNEEDCKKVSDSNHFEQFVTQVKPTGVVEVGSKTISTLEVNQSMYKRLNAVEKRLMVIVLVKNVNNENQGYAIEYSNPNKIRLLREGRALQDKVRLLEKKYYKYINNNPKVTEIRIHLNEISGLTRIRAKRTGILEEGGNEISMEKEIPNTIVVKERVTSPIYLEVHGIVTSLYTISVSAIHPEHVTSNALVMAEDVEYQVKLLPYKHMNVELHPIESDVVFEFYSEGGSVTVCEIDNNGTCYGKTTIGSQGQVKISSDKKRQIRMRIENSVRSINSNGIAKETAELSTTELVRRVTVTLIYHAADLNHCDERRVNKVYSQNVKLGACFKYHLPLANDIEIMLSRSDLGEFQQKYFLCSKKITPVEINNRFIIKESVIQENCKQLPNDMRLVMVVGNGSLGKEQQSVKVDYSVEYNNDIITLAEGVAYVTKGYSITETAMRTFFYEIMDENRDINIVMFNKKGNQKFYANVVSKLDKYSEIVSEIQAKFSSRNSSYYFNPNVKVNSSDIAKAKCGRSCVLVISVYSQSKAGSEVEYALQVTQNHVYLKQDEIRRGFLSKGSVEFFEYECRVLSGSVIFKVSDNNRKCAHAIMSMDPFPTESNFIIKENEGTIIYQKSVKSTVYFSVEAIQDCPYSVSVSEQLVKLTKIEHGQFYDIKLQAGQQKWFYHRHASNTSFKVLSLKKYGELQIFANGTDLDKSVLERIRSNNTSTESFAFKSQYQNTLFIDSNDKKFCVNCYYLICIHAVRITEGSIMIGSSSTKIPLTQKKILFDSIETENTTTYASYYRVSAGNLQVKVHSGKINFEMTYDNQKFAKQFIKNNKVYHEHYNFTRNEHAYTPIQVKITAVEVPALYSFEMSPQTNSVLFNHRVNPGEHTYLFLMKGEIECLTGTLISKNQQVFITADAEDKHTLSNLNITVKLNGKDTDKYEKELVGNLMAIKFQLEPKLLTIQNYSICLKTNSPNETLSLFAFQNQNVNLIHSDMEVLVRKESKFVLYPKTDIILDLFECRGSAELYYGPRLDNIRSKQSQKLEIIGIPGQNHAIKIQSYTALYINVLAEMATVLWMPIRANLQRGIGYFKYAIGRLQYNSRFNMIDFTIGGIFQRKQTATKPTFIKYTLFISNSKQLLQQAVMCERVPKNKLISASVSTSKVGVNQSQPISISMQKRSITDQFSSNETLYFNVVADMTLRPPNATGDTDHQHYRFIYFEQLVPSQVFRQNRIESMQLALLIGLIVVAVIGFLFTTYIFLRFIVPALGRLKNRVLVEEKDDPKEQSIPVPPSSERNQIAIVTPSGTDEQLKK